MSSLFSALASETPPHDSSFVASNKDSLSQSCYFLCFQSLQEVRETCTKVDCFDSISSLVKTPTNSLLPTYCLGVLHGDTNHSRVSCLHDSYLKDVLPFPACCNAVIICKAC